MATASRTTITMIAMTPLEKRRRTLKNLPVRRGAGIRLRAVHPAVAGSPTGHAPARRTGVDRPRARPPYRSRPATRPPAVPEPTEAGPPGGRVPRGDPRPGR
ncbi:hypothetical protein GCM10027187_44690 [Streptosporangium sandarakinum]